jgi:hypothetical protein
MLLSSAHKTGLMSSRQPSQPTSLSKTGAARQKVIAIAFEFDLQCATPHLRLAAESLPAIGATGRPASAPAAASAARARHRPTRRSRRHARRAAPDVRPSRGARLRPEARERPPGKRVSPARPAEQCSRNFFSQTYLQVTAECAIRILEDWGYDPPYAIRGPAALDPPRNLTKRPQTHHVT